MLNINKKAQLNFPTRLLTVKGNDDPLQAEHNNIKFHICSLITRTLLSEDRFLELENVQQKNYLNIVGLAEIQRNQESYSRENSKKIGQTNYSG